MKEVKNESKETVVESTAVAVNNDIASLDVLSELQNPSGAMYCSLKNDGTRKSAVAIYNAINRADKQISEHIGEVLEVVNVVAHPIQLPDEETGEIVNCLRTVFITKDGTNYVAVSQGVASSLSRIFSIVGTPEDGAWESEPVKMKFVKVKTRNANNFVTTIELV